MDVRSQSGMTLFEIMITLMIVSIIGCLSIPAFLHHSSSPQLQKKEIISILAYARLQAFLQHEPLVLAPLALTSEHAWLNGIKLYIPSASSPLKVQKKLHEWHWPNQSFTLKWFGYQSKDTILVNAEADKLAMNGYFLLDNQHKWIVNRFGRVK